MFYSVFPTCILEYLVRVCPVPQEILSGSGKREMTNVAVLQSLTVQWIGCHFEWRSPEQRSGRQHISDSQCGSCIPPYPDMTQVMDFISSDATKCVIDWCSRGHRIYSNLDGPTVARSWTDSNFRMKRFLWKLDNLGFYLRDHEIRHDSTLGRGGRGRYATHLAITFYTAM